jgi:hypothetical protein
VSRSAVHFVEPFATTTVPLLVGPPTGVSRTCPDPGRIVAALTVRSVSPPRSTVVTTVAFIPSSPAYRSDALCPTGGDA